MLFNDSLERCTQNPDFLRHFYDLFLATSPEVAEKFQKHRYAAADASIETITFFVSLGLY